MPSLTRGHRCRALQLQRPRVVIEAVSMPAGSGAPSQAPPQRGEGPEAGGLAANPTEHPSSSSPPPALPADLRSAQQAQPSGEVTHGLGGACQEFPPALHLQLRTEARVGSWRQVLVSAARNCKSLPLPCHGRQKACTVFPELFVRGWAFLLVGGFFLNLFFFLKRKKSIKKKSKQHFNKI